MMAIVDKVIIVEGKSDKKRVQQVIAEPVNIICTHGTMSIDSLIKHSMMTTCVGQTMMTKEIELEIGLNVI